MEKRSKQKLLDRFVEKAKIKHGDKYDYSKVVYIQGEDKVTIVCPEHGDFVQRRALHLYSSGCPQCGRKKLKQCQPKTREKFIEDAQNKHEDKYDYSKVVYVRNNMKVEIVCPFHDSFFQKPNDHLTGYECPKCGTEKVSAKIRITSEEFVLRAQVVHSNKYDYSLVENFKDSRSYLQIVCPDHGSFEQTAKNHLGGHGCPNCGRQFSKAACDWMKRMAEKDDVKIHTVLDGKEKAIRVPGRKLPYRVDGWCEETKTVYEYNGCIWHGCPKCFSPEDINPVTKRKMEDHYRETIEKEETLRELGYNVVVMWECQKE